MNNNVWECHTVIKNDDFGRNIVCWKQCKLAFRTHAKCSYSKGLPKSNLCFISLTDERLLDHTFLIDYLWISHNTSQSHVKSLPIFLMPLQSPPKTKGASPPTFQKKNKRKLTLKKSQHRSCSETQ